VVQLEHDGILSTQYHRGAFVQRFDESVVREHHEVYGILNGIASARAAADRDPAIIAQLDALMEVMRNNREARAFQEAGWQFRAMINEQYCGPRLLALIHASQAFVPRSFWVSYLHNYEEMLAHFEGEIDAIHRGDPDAARAVSVARADMMARILLGELVRRGVFTPAGAPSVAF
jgi:DNA-binding GntR family transcriptional regulator